MAHLKCYFQPTHSKPKNTWHLRWGQYKLACFLFGKEFKTWFKTQRSNAEVRKACSTATPWKIVSGKLSNITGTICEMKKPLQWKSSKAWNSPALSQELLCILKHWLLKYNFPKIMHATCQQINLFNGNCAMIAIEERSLFFLLYEMDILATIGWRLFRPNV